MAIPLRGDYDAVQLRVAARRTKNAARARRLLSLAAVYDGATGTEAARIGGVTLQIVRDWVLKFNSAGPDGLIDRKALPCHPKPSTVPPVSRYRRIVYTESGQRDMLYQNGVPPPAGLADWQNASIVDPDQFIEVNWAALALKAGVPFDLEA